ncbi:sucrose transport protein [Colletotrichum kahawae]|uniref:Sucrose transport protein n=1 Tax=Colletotrichum kahawae TaxID=34407 RepID=A0AAE0DCT9_COLKA|nr:sucrose transport protein [Colletotrichum kahawae]
MKTFESTDLPVGIPLVVASTSPSTDASANKLAHERPHTSLWGILAYAVPSMPIQAFFTMFTVYLIPYLTLELAFAVSHVSLVLLAGPLSGLTVAPIMGVLSDRSGRRLGLFTTGCVAMAACQIVLAWSRELGGSNPAAVKWLSATAVYIGCISARASIVGHRAMAIDNIPPRQQPVFNLATGLMAASGASITLILGLVRPSFKVITAVCAVLITFSIFPLWAVRKPPAVHRQPIVREESDRFGALSAVLSVPRTLWDAARHLPPGIHRTCKIQILSHHDTAFSSLLRHAFGLTKGKPDVATRGRGSEAVAPDVSARAGVRVLLIAEVGAFLLQMTVVRLWDASSASTKPVRRFMDEDMVALRRVWALAFAALGVSTLAAVVFRGSFPAAPICAASIMTISPLSVLVPFTIISYETAVVHEEKNGDPSTPRSSATLFSLHEMAITMGQGLAVLTSGLIGFGIEHIDTEARNTTAFLFAPAVVAAMIAALLC